MVCRDRRGETAKITMQRWYANYTTLGYCLGIYTGLDGNSLIVSYTYTRLGIVFWRNFVKNNFCLIEEEIYAQGQLKKLVRSLRRFAHSIGVENVIEINFVTDNITDYMHDWYHETEIFLKCHISRVFRYLSKNIEKLKSYEFQSERIQFLIFFFKQGFFNYFKVVVTQVEKIEILFFA